MVRFAIPLPASTQVDAPHLFVETQDVVDYAAPQNFSRSGDRIIVETRAKGDKAGPVSALLKLGGGRGLSLALEPGEIGGASWRDGGCPWGEVLWVAGSLKIQKVELK